MQAPVEICYAGVVIARAEEVREGEGGEFFIVMKDPLPVGTLVGVRSADSLISTRVLRVVESADATESGMQVRPAKSDDAGVAMWVPPPAAKNASAPAAIAVPVFAAPPALDNRAPMETASADASPVQAAPPISAVAPAEVPAEPTTTEAVEREASASVDNPALPAGEAVAAAEAAPAAPTGSTDSAAPAQASVSSSNGASEEAAASEAAAEANAVETAGEAAAPSDTAAPPDGDLPPARPVQAAGGRRRTKRRRTS
jgi:hypothetical protein